MSDHHSGHGGWFKQRADRRAILKASAMFAAAAAAPGTIRSLSAKAQSAPTSQSGYFSEVLQNAFTTASEARQFQTDFGITAVAPHWAGTAAAGGYVTLQFSSDGETWTDPVSSAVWADAKDGGDKDGRYFGHLVAVTDSPTYIQYQTFDVNDQPVQLPDLVLSYWDTSNGPLASDLVTTAATPSVDQPVVISRAEWGANEDYRHDDQDPSKPILWGFEYVTVDQVVIHHSVTTNLQDPMVTIRSIYEYHAITRGWGDIGYNYLVDYRGNVYEGRRGGDNVVGGHALGYNYGSSGICMMGDFTSVDVTPDAQAGLIWIASWAGRALDPHGSKDYYDPEHNVPHRVVPMFAGHRDCWPSGPNVTECPGDVLHSDLPYIRDAIADVLNLSANPGESHKFLHGDHVYFNSTANMRSNAGTDFDVIDTASSGQTAVITDGPVSRTGYEWYEVETADGTTGWVADSLLNLDSASVQDNKFSANERVQTNADDINLRTSASTDAGVVAVLSAGVLGKIVDGPTRAGGFIWYRVDTSRGTGWIDQDYISTYSKPRGKFVKGDTVYTNSDLSVRANAGTDAALVTTVGKGHKFTITYAYNLKNGMEWYQVSSSSAKGWVSGDYLTKNAPLSNKPVGKFIKGDEVKVNANGVAIHEKAGVSTKVLKRVDHGATFAVVYAYNRKDGYEWYQVKGNQGTGWIAGDFLDTAPPLEIKVGFTVYVSDGPVNMRNSPSTGARQVNIIPQDAKLKVVDGPRTGSGYTWWKLYSLDWGEGWVADPYIERRITL